MVQVSFTRHPSASSIIINSWLWLISACLPPTEPENGGYRCHPSPCHHFTHKTVIEYFCDEGYALKADYKFLTCQNGEWDSPMQITCRLTQGLFVAALSIIWYMRHTSHFMTFSFLCPQTRSRLLHWEYRLCQLWHRQPAQWLLSCF